MASYFFLLKSLVCIVLPVFVDNKALHARIDLSFHIAFVLWILNEHNQLLKFTGHASIIFLPNALNAILSIQSKERRGEWCIRNILVLGEMI
jgi:hypothetical protein